MHLNEGSRTLAHTVDLRVAHKTKVLTNKTHPNRFINIHP